MPHTQVSWLIRGGITLFWMGMMVLLLSLPSLGNFFKQEKSLTVFAWPATIDPKYLKKFEKRTGIKLYISYFNSNEELYSKMRATKGKGYDIIFPSDYAVLWLLKDGLLKKLDKSKLSLSHDFDPKLLGHYFDPLNEYSLPYFWGVYGLGIDKNYFGGKMPEPTWGLVFDSRKAPPAVGMSDVPREVIMMVAQYLYGNIESLKDPKNREVVFDLLVKQKQWVEVYNDARSDDLLISRAAPVVVGISLEIGRVAQEDAALDFIIPREGGFLVIDSIAIPSASSKDDLIYQFINFMYEEHVTWHHIKKFGLCASTLIDVNDEKEAFCPTARQLGKIDFFRNVISEDIFNDMWIRLMAH